MFGLSNIVCAPSIGLYKDGGTHPAPPPFFPTDLDDLVLWLNAEQADSIIVDGSNQLVNQNDLSGNGVNKIPLTDAIPPTLIPSVMRGVSLFRLNDTDKVMLEKSILDFAHGWDYSGPIVQGHVYKFKGGDGGGYFSASSFFNSAFFQFISFLCFTDNYNIAGVDAFPIELNQVPSYLSSLWIGPINSKPPDACSMCILSFKGTTRNEGMAYFSIPASGSIPAFFASIPLTPFVKSLCCSFVSGCNESGSELYEAESFMSLEDSPSTEFSRVRDYLLRWFDDLKAVALCIGDSLTNGFIETQADAYPYQLGLLQTGTDFINAGINGRTAEMLEDDFPKYSALKRPGVPNTVNVWVLTNNIAGGDDAATCITKLTSLVSVIKTAGWFCRVIDCIPRNFGAPVPGNPQDATKEAIRLEVNGLLHTVGADDVIHLCNSAPFNDVDAWSNPTYYDGDQVHLIAAGKARVAQLINGSE